MMARRKRRPKVAADAEPLVTLALDERGELVFDSSNHDSWVTFWSDLRSGTVTVDCSTMSGRPKLDAAEIEALIDWLEDTLGVAKG